MTERITKAAIIVLANMPSDLKRVWSNEEDVIGISLGHSQPEKFEVRFGDAYPFINVSVAMDHLEIRLEYKIHSFERISDFQTTLSDAQKVLSFAKTLEREFLQPRPWSRKEAMGVLEDLKYYETHGVWSRFDNKPPLWWRELMDEGFEIEARNYEAYRRVAIALSVSES